MKEILMDTDTEERRKEDRGIALKVATSAMYGFSGVRKSEENPCIKAVEAQKKGLLIIFYDDENRASGKSIQMMLLQQYFANNGRESNCYIEDTDAVSNIDDLENGAVILVETNCLSYTLALLSKPDILICCQRRVPSWTLGQTQLAVDLEAVKKIHQEFPFCVPRSGSFECDMTGKTIEQTHREILSLLFTSFDSVD